MESRAEAATPPSTPLPPTGPRPPQGGKYHYAGCVIKEAHSCVFASVRLLSSFIVGQPAMRAFDGCRPPYDQPSIVMVFFSGILAASFFGTCSLRTPSSNFALISSSVTLLPTKKLLCMEPA